MRKILIAICVLCQLSTLAQEVKKKRRNDETFYVLKSDESIRHGEYIRKSTAGVAETGQYEMNKKVGVWVFYGLDGSIEQKYNYTEQKLLFNDNLTVISTRYQIIKDGSETSLTPSEDPILIGGPSKYFRHLMNTQKYPSKARAMGTQGQVLVSVVIDADGKMRDAKVIEGLGNGCDEEALRVINAFECEWIPATNDGKKVDVMTVLALKFRIG